MKIRVLGAGWYGCAISTALIADGHDVEVHESGKAIFSGASGSNPARLHLGFHYPRSYLTRELCREHNASFMQEYGFLTRHVPTNLYCIANDSLLDFLTYKAVLKSDLEFVTVHDPKEYGLENVEGAILTNERHIVIGEARKHFESMLDGHVRYETPIGIVDDPKWDLTIDCTFSALDASYVDRYEPCLTVLLESDWVQRAVTIMDGPFPSLYPWDEEAGLSSLTSAKYTPISKECKTYKEARYILDGFSNGVLKARAETMLEQMAEYWPQVRDMYRIVDYRLGIRAMPKSASDARTPRIVKVGEKAIRVVAGKIDAVVYAVREIRAQLKDRVHVGVTVSRPFIDKEYGLRRPVARR